ncbi:uncharacterized protein LOC144563470 [Carex rostrata]
MASSPEMEPPGFEQISRPPSTPLPPPSESPPTQIDPLNSNSPDAAPPGFENPNAYPVMCGTDTWDPPTFDKNSTELPALETSSIGNGCRSDEYRETGMGPHVSEKPEVAAVPFKQETVDPFQSVSSATEIKTLGPLLEPPEIENPMESMTVGPQKIEILDPAMWVPPPPPSESSEKNLIGDELEGTQIEEGTFETVAKPETAPGLIGNEAPFGCQTPPLLPVPVFQSLVPESVSVSVSVSESLGLPPSPPPLPSLSESILPESSHQNLDPLPPLPPLPSPLPPPPPPPPPPSLIVHDTPSLTVVKSEYDSLNQNTCDNGLIEDAIPSEHYTVGSAQLPLAPQEVEILDPTMLPPPPPPPTPPPPQFKCESVVPLLPEMTELRRDNHNQLQPLKEEIQDPPIQVTEIVSCSNRDDTPDMLSFETGSPANQITDEPPMKKFRNMYEMQGQLTPDAYQREVEKYPPVSETPEMNSHQGEAMETLHIDMEMSDDETFDRSPTDMGPPGSDTRDSESPEEAPPGYDTSEAPPGYDTIDPTSQTEMIFQDALSGMGQMVCGSCHELIYYPRGALHVLCTCCQIINLVLEACQVGNITCGQCSMLLMYPFGAPSVRCSCCRYVTEIGAHNMRPPLTIQQGEGYTTLDLQSTEIS